MTSAERPAGGTALEPVHRQPLLDAETVILRAPTQAWCAADGRMGTRDIHGVYFSDVRILSRVETTFSGSAGEPIQTSSDGADAVTFVAMLRELDGVQVDPRLRALVRRQVTTIGLVERVTLESGLPRDVDVRVEVSLASDLADMDVVKAGGATADVPITVAGDGATWSKAAIQVGLAAPAAQLSSSGDGVTLTWDLVVPAHSSISISWSVTAEDVGAVVAGVSTPADWAMPEPTGDDRLDRWLAQALVDLDALRMTVVAQPGSTFLAAGAPWFFTLFGRDSIWAARFLLPLGGTIAADTLRALAGMQGTARNPDSAEQPGKIMHELRRQSWDIPHAGMLLPPLYFGTVDATALWICLLHDAWKAGMPDTEVMALLPNLEAALAWMRDYGDSDGDGFLEYLDESGRGLANQGWKDSSDSVQWSDGRLAEGPIALCEVQGYAYEAAMHGADLLDHLGGDGAPWRDWAAALKAAFAAQFWVSDAVGRYPAIALDAHKRPVDSLTSNIGHLLGTGILTSDEAAIVASRLVTPELSSGFGLRTLSTAAAGYWPLSYHGGSVWAHDTAIAIRGLVAEGHADAAAELAEGLLAAAASFDYRMPELHSGDASESFTKAIPYPAACRPQAWSAGAAVAVWDALQSPRGARAG